MEIYYVGGLVRDYLRSMPAKDKDFVVVGSTPEEMLSLGYKQVGGHFPVFLHPKNKCEYALARTEKSTGNTYQDFSCDFGPDVSLRDDLYRRDLTINAIAATPQPGGSIDIYDPFDGEADIINNVLRHVSPAFVEDPVRVLRIAKFAARFGPNWEVAQETKFLIYKMGKAGVLNSLTPERIWKELSEAMSTEHPRLFFDTLLNCDVLHILFPEVYALVSATEWATHHPEGNAYEHTMLVLQEATRETDVLARFVALTHDFGKGLTTKDKLPSHFGHENTGIAVLENFFTRLKAPKIYKEVCVSTTKYHMYMHKLESISARKITKMFNSFKSKHFIVNYLANLGVNDANGRAKETSVVVEDFSLLFKALAAYSSVKFCDVFSDKPPNDAAHIKAAIHQARVAAINKILT